MKCLPLCLLAALWASPLPADENRTDWAYHSIGDGTRLSDRIPGMETAFLGNGTDQIADSETVELFLLTDRDFAGDMDEQIYVRWWDGAMAHWIMGVWVKNVVLDASSPETRFRDLPADGKVLLDLWKLEIPPWITQPGDNFYAIQLKGYREGRSEERYLLSRPGGDFSRTNRFGQVWSASEEFDGQDWKINVLP